MKAGNQTIQELIYMNTYLSEYKGTYYYSRR